RRDPRRAALSAQHLRRQRRPEVAQRDAVPRRRRGPERGATPAYDCELQPRLSRLPAELSHLHADGRPSHSPLPRGRLEARPGDDGALRQLTAACVSPAPAPTTQCAPSPGRAPAISPRAGRFAGCGVALTVPPVAPRRTRVAC